jgi:lipopolysaccharide transport system ATP-binding protein
VRLAFAVAAFLEPDILIVDEVLAVGDAEFQKKAIGKMQDISSQGGRTVLFVSHDMGAIEGLCTKCILLENGRIIQFDKTRKVVSSYLNNKNNYKKETVFFKNDLFLKSIKLLSEKQESIDLVLYGTSIFFNVEIGSKKEIENDFIFEIKIKSETEKVLSTFSTYLNAYRFDDSGGTTRKIRCKVNSVDLVPGKYYIDLIVVKYMESDKLSTISDVLSFEVIESNNFSFSNKIKPKYHGDFLMNYEWI